jgi:sugar/nucleoside kinase (ribokinase family)
MMAVHSVLVHSVLVAGHLCIDITPELSAVPDLVPGQLYEIGSAQFTLGGCVANTGLALAASGVPTRVCARVGNDPLGEITRRLLAEQEVDLSDVTITPGAATSYSIVLHTPGRDRTFWHHAGANAAFTGREVNLDGVDILHLGYPPLLPGLLADDAAPLLNLLKEARSLNITTSLDLAVVDRQSRAAEVDWRRVFARIMPYVDIATPSIDDLTSALAITQAGDDDLVEECARQLVADGCAVAVVSAGAHSHRLAPPGARRRSGFPRRHRGLWSTQLGRVMPHPPDSYTALPKAPAFGRQFASVLSSLQPPSRGTDPRRCRLTAGPPNWPQRAWTDRRMSPASTSRAS